MDIFEMLDHNGQETLFHGVRGATLHQLIQESESGHIHLYGRSFRDEEEDESEELLAHLRGTGFLYTTRYSAVELSAQEFCEERWKVFSLADIFEM